MSKTTFDLSTLSDIADGAHTVKVKAKADGYIDSEFSNEVSYTKAPSGNQFWYMKYFTDNKSSHNAADIYFYNASNEQVSHVAFWWDTANKVLKGSINGGDAIVGDYNSEMLKLNVNFKAVRCTVRPWSNITSAYAGYDYRDKRVSLPIKQTSEIDVLNWDSTFAVSVYS